MFFFENGQPDDDYRTQLGRRIEAVVGLYPTKTKASNAAGVSVEQLNKWIKGSVKVPVEALRALSQGVDADFSWVVVGDDDTRAVARVNSSDHSGLAELTVATNSPVTQTMGRGTRSSGEEVDIDLLERAIAVIERGLKEANRKAEPDVKAGMVAAAYQILSNASDASEQRVLKLVRG